MSLIQKLAEEKIRVAIDQGAFDDLPGRGKPLVLDDNSSVPEELKAAYRLLKNAGYLPPEVELRTEISQVEDLLQQVEDEPEERKLVAKLNLLRARLAGGGQEGLVFQEERYREKILQKVSGN